MNEKRTITALRENSEGRMYIHFRNNEVCRQFLKDAENEGFRFGRILPTKSEPSNIIAIEKNHQLSYVGFAGHVAVQCNAVPTVDYERYIAGENDYFFKFGK